MNFDLMVEITGKGIYLLKARTLLIISNDCVSLLLIVCLVMQRRMNEIERNERVKELIFYLGGSQRVKCFVVIGYMQIRVICVSMWSVRTK